MTFTCTSPRRRSIISSSQTSLTSTFPALPRTSSTARFPNTERRLSWNISRSPSSCQKMASSPSLHPFSHQPRRRIISSARRCWQSLPTSPHVPLHQATSNSSRTNLASTSMPASYRRKTPMTMSSRSRCCRSSTESRCASATTNISLLPSRHCPSYPFLLRNARSSLGRRCRYERVLGEYDRGYIPLRNSIRYSLWM